MNRYKENFSKYTSEHLLEKRALGDELTDEAHKAIEEIFTERGELLPPRPVQPIDMKQRRKAPINKKRVILSLLGVFVVMGIAKAVATILANSWVGLLISAVYVGYLIFDWIRRRGLDEEELKQEEYKEKIDGDALTELMVASAEGKAARVKELLDYGVDYDEKSLNGSTALMYAARNNHIDVVKLLVNAGANVQLMNEKKSTALSIAKNFECEEVVDFLSFHTAR
jgi:hypothetical protein